jgi:hypothetical protein
MEKNKELFFKTMNLLKEQYEHDRKCHEAFSKILPNDYVSNYDNDKLYTACIELLEELVNDKAKWIEYFIWENDFGCNEFEAFINGVKFELKTIDDLWNIITYK